MTAIKAFVGHSFAEADAEVVRVFLDYFDEVSAIHSPFSWDHAEEAEPRPLTEKILEIIDGKNVLIAICTFKEYAIEKPSLLDTIFPRGFRKAKTGDFKAKASDWVTQEIGLAIGRKMKVIIFLEEGVREPGGLQGDIEYISFDRDKPHKSFQKFLQMIKSFNPKAQPSLPVLATAIAPTADTPKAPDASPLIPQPDWSSTQYRRALFSAAIGDDEEAMGRIGAAYLGTPDASEGDNRPEWDAWVEFTRIIWGRNPDLGKLKALSASHPNNAEIARFLARGYSKYGAPAEAAKLFLSVGEKAGEASDKIFMLGNAAEEFQSAGDEVAAQRVIDNIKHVGEENGAEEIQLLRILRTLADAQKDDATRIAVMERILEIAPEDVGVRFDLGYRHSQHGNDELALVHYLKIPPAERSDDAWNNIGVAYDRLDCSGKAISAFKKSKEAGGTLAMTNLGNKLLTAGFIDEANEECNEAVKVADFHPNVGTLIASIQKSTDDEDEAERNLVAKAKQKADFYRMLGRAISKIEPSDLGGIWKAEECDLKIQLVGKLFSASGTYARPANQLAAALSPGYPMEATSHNLIYTGVVDGFVVSGTVRREPAKKTASSALGLLSDGMSSPFVGYIRDDRSAIEILDDHSSAGAKYYSIMRR